MLQEGRPIRCLLQGRARNDFENLLQKRWLETGEVVLTDSIFDELFFAAEINRLRDHEKLRRIYIRLRKVWTTVRRSCRILQFSGLPFSASQSQKSCKRSLVWTLRARSLWPRLDWSFLYCPRCRSKQGSAHFHRACLQRDLRRTFFPQ